MTPDNAARLARAKEAMELAEKATEGPWTACHKGGCSCGFVSSPHLHVLRAEVRSHYSIDDMEADELCPKTETQGHNARFAAAARTLVPDLAAEVEALVAQNNELRDEWELTTILHNTIAEENYQLRERAEAAEKRVAELEAAHKNFVNRIGSSAEAATGVGREEFGRGWKAACEHFARVGALTMKGPDHA